MIFLITLLAIIIEILVAILPFIVIYNKDKNSLLICIEVLHKKRNQFSIVVSIQIVMIISIDLKKNENIILISISKWLMDQDRFIIVAGA
jgi:hypothetical protein